MAITHSDFLTQVRNYTEVDANVLSDSIIQDFIRNVELDMMILENTLPQLLPLVIELYLFLQMH